MGNYLTLAYIFFEPYTVYNYLTLVACCTTVSQSLLYTTYWTLRVSDPIKHDYDCLGPQVQAQCSLPQRRSLHFVFNV